MCRARGGEGAALMGPVIVYSGTEASKRIGGEAAEALGTGTVAASGQDGPHPPQSGVVDVTVIVGADFVAQGTPEAPLKPPPNTRDAPQRAEHEPTRPPTRHP